MIGPREEALKDNIEELRKLAESSPLPGEFINKSMDSVLLTSIASSLAAIADKMTEGDWENADTGSDKTANSES